MCALSDLELIAPPRGVLIDSGIQISYSLFFSCMSVLNSHHEIGQGKVNYSAVDFFFLKLTLDDFWKGTPFRPCLVPKLFFPKTPY